VTDPVRFITASRRTDEGYRLVLPLPPNLGNARLHWRAKNRKKQDYHRFLDALASDRRFPSPHGEPPDRVRIAASLYVWNYCDPDNAMARLKWPLDWLVRNGYAADDNRASVEWAGIPWQAIDRKWQRVVVAITAAEAP
jgi:hypothetical protein